MVDNADAIVQGEVVSKKSFEYGDDIYTVNEVKIISILKDNNEISSKLSIVTLGGRTADKTQSYSHVAHLNVEDEGIFLLEKSSIRGGAIQLIGETNGYYRESNKYKGRYFSYAGYFESLTEFKSEIASLTNQSEKKIIQRGCFNLSIDFNNSTNVNSDEARFRILCSSDIPSTYLNSLHLPLIYDPAEYISDPFDAGAITMALSQELEENYILDQERMDENNMAFLISRNSASEPIFIGSEFVPIFEGSIDITALEVEGLPHIDILKSTLLGNTSYVTLDDPDRPKRWTCLDTDNIVFHEFIPRIDSIAPLNVAAGVGDMSENGIPGMITIYGSGFGTPAPGMSSAGMVGFPDAETIIPTSPLTTMASTFPAELDYIFWSDSIIKVRVPTRNNNTDDDGVQGTATSGRVTVEVNGNNALSNQELYVHFGMSNDYTLDSAGVIGAKKRRMSAKFRSINNSIQGYRLQIDQSVLDSIPNAFDRINSALDEWRCDPDHPIWIEVDTLSTGLHTGIISMGTLQNASLAALTGIVVTHHDCSDISVSNTIEITLNSNFTFVNFPVNTSDSAYFEKVLVHEFGHGFLARHTVNRAIMYPDGFFENISTLAADDHLCGVHTFNLGNTGPACNPTNSQTEMDLNIGSFDCPTNVTRDMSSKKQRFNLYPNPTNEYFVIDIEEMGSLNELEIRIINARGEVKYIDKVVGERINVSSMLPGLYFVQLIQNNIILGTEKLIIHE